MGGWLAWCARPGALAMAAVMLVAAPPAPVSAAADTDTLVATLDGNNLPSDGDPGGSGAFSIALDPGLGQGCFTIDVVLTDLAGDPPTAIDVRDSRTGDPGDVVLALATAVDAAGHAAGCLAVPGALISAMLASPNDYTIDVSTAAYPEGAIRGWIHYSYATGPLGVHTRICPAAIQSVAQLTDAAKEQCLVVVLPKDDISPHVPDGYAVSGYGGTATFDYAVSDGKHLDATLADAERGGGGTCSSTTRSCNFAWLPYEWGTAAMGEIHVVPTLLPAGTRFGTAEGRNGNEPGEAIPTTIGLDHDISIDASGKMAVWMAVYLFRDPDTTRPTVTTPTIGIRRGATFDSRVPVRVAWSGSDAGSGIDHYTVQRSVDGGSWTTVAPAVTSTHYDTGIAPGHAYRFRIGAYDRAGNTRTSAASASGQGRVVQDSSASVVYRGSWRRVHAATASGGTLGTSSTAAATATLRFTGRSIAWVAPVGLARGSARVYIDGTRVETVNLNGPAAPRAVAFSKRFASVATHTITIRVVGTAGHPRVDVDAFLYLR